MTSPAMDAALAAPVIVDFMAVEVALPFATIRLLAGASELKFPVPDPTTGIPGAVQTFTGEDPVYGTLSSIDGTTEGLGTSSPRLRITLNPPTRVAAAQLNLPTNQNAMVRLWYGCLNVTTGEVIPDPLSLFWGKLDQPRFVGGPTRAHGVEYDAASAMESLFASDEGQRLNHAFHIRVFPGELGLQYVTEVERNLPWGQNVARAAMIAASGGGYDTAPGTGSPGGGGGWTGGGGGGGGGGGTFTTRTLQPVSV